jgi:hypothetical protein
MWSTGVAEGPSGLLRGLGWTTTSTRIEEQQEKKDYKEPRKKVQIIRSMGAVKWQLRSAWCKKEVNKKQKPNLQNWKGADTAAALLLQKSDHRQAALEQDNS